MKILFIFCRIFGWSGVILSFVVAYMIAGGNPVGLFVASEWMIVLGITGFALLATYGWQFFLFMGDALLASVCQRPPNEAYVRIARSGIFYSLTSAFIGIIAGLIITLGHLDGPLTEVGHHLASCLTGPLLGAFLSGILFPYLASNYQSQTSKQISGVKTPPGD